MQIDKSDVQAVVYFNKATAYLVNKRIDKAIQFFKKALKLFPAKEVYVNYAYALTHLNRDHEAAELLKIARDPTTPLFSREVNKPYPLALCNSGLLRYRQGDDLGAIAYYTETLKANPGYPECVWNYSNALLRRCSSLKSTNWDMAWKTYDFRFEHLTRVDTRITGWDEKNFCDTLVVLSEQGLGDKIQFGRYLHLLKPFCNRLIVQLPKKLNTLFHGFETCEDITPFVVETSRSVPMCSLARIFGWDSAPATWIDRGLFEPTKFEGSTNILVEWTGSTTHSNAHNRNTVAEHFLVLSEVGSLYSFKKGNYKNIVGLDQEDSWHGTACAILGSSVLVTVDTSVAHLCGSLGHPCVLIQPYIETDWRWGDDSMGLNNVWYPSVFVIRNQQNWTKALEEARDFLKGLTC